MALEQRTRQDIENRHAGFAAILVPLVVLGAIVTIGLLALTNSRQRSQEIGDSAGYRIEHATTDAGLPH